MPGLDLEALASRYLGYKDGVKGVECVVRPPLYEVNSIFICSGIGI